MKLRLNCPECKEKIEYRDVNIAKAIARCRKCESIFEFEKVLASAKVPKEKVLLPEAMEAYYMLTGFDIEINWRKSSASFKFFLFFAIFWNGIVSIFVITALATGSYDFLWPMAFHIIIGLGLLYYILAVLLNKTYIGVSQWDLTVEHKPLPMPFFKTHDISSKSIEQVYVERYVASKTNGRPDYAFAVMLRKEGAGKPVKIMKGLKTLDQGRFIEQEIEKFLHIEDKPMKGEWMV
jgi:hypothetical protein